MAQANLLSISVVTPTGILFSGEAHSVIAPGEKGVFEILVNHKPILSLLRRGELNIDGRFITIRRGIIKVVHNKIAAIVETS